MYILLRHEIALTLIVINKLITSKILGEIQVSIYYVLGIIRSFSYSKVHQQEQDFRKFSNIGF